MTSQFIKKYRIVKFSELPTGVNFRYCNDWYVKHSKHESVNKRTSNRHSFYKNRYVGIEEYTVIGSHSY